MKKPCILVVNMMVPAGDGEDPQYTGEWRGTYGLSIALASAGADVTLLSPSIGKHEAVVRSEIDPVALAAGVKIRYANFVLNRRITSYMTLRLSLAWLREYLKLKPDLVIFKQARPDVALLIPGLKNKALVLSNDLGDLGAASSSLKEDSNLIYRDPTRFEVILDKLSHWLIWSMAKIRPPNNQYGWLGIMTGEPTHEDMPDVDSDDVGENVLRLRKGLMAYPARVWKPHDHFDDVDVVFCGIIGLRKGVFELIEAWKQVRPDAKLAIVGTGPPEMLERLTQELATLPNAKFSNVTYWGSLGFFEKFALFNKAKLLVLPSKRDFRPVVIYEAFATGLPVVTTRQILSQVRHGENGLLVDADDINGLAEAINHLLTHEDERKRMSACARQTIADYSWDDAVEQILALAATT